MDFFDFRHYVPYWTLIAGFLLIINCLLWLYTGNNSFYKEGYFIPVNGLATSFLLLFYSAKLMIDQSNAMEVKNSFQISREVSKKFKDYKNQKDASVAEDKLEYEFEEIIGLMEDIARLYNARKFGTVSSCMVEELLIPIISDFVKDDRMKKIKGREHKSTREKVYEHLYKFTKRQFKKRKVDDESMNAFHEIMKIR